MKTESKDDAMRKIPLEILPLPAEQWRILRKLRLAALKDSPHSFLASYDLESRRRPEEWQEECSTAAWQYAKVGEKNVGLAKLARCNDPDVEWHIEAMWVDPLWRGCGIAEALVRRIEELTREKGEDVLGLWIFDGNGKARRLYERLGFAKVGEKGNRQLIDSISEPGNLIWEEELRKHFRDSSPRLSFR